MDILNKINVNATDVALKDGIFDISEYNNGATYANLDAALNNGNNLPDSVKYGGLTIKFKDSNTQRYEQYRLTSTTWNTTERNWEYIISDGIYDISAMNGGMYYADLSTALNAIPTNHRKGGMSVKFITEVSPATYSVVKTEGLETEPTGTELSNDPNIESGTYIASQLISFPVLPTSIEVANAVTYWIEVTGDTTTYTKWVVTMTLSINNNYVQFRLTSLNFSNNVSDWQGVDEEPVYESRNLVESGGVYKDSIETKLSIYDKNINIPYVTSPGYINSNKIINSTNNRLFYFYAKKNIKYIVNIKSSVSKEDSQVIKAISNSIPTINSTVQNVSAISIFSLNKTEISFSENVYYIIAVSYTLIDEYFSINFARMHYKNIIGIDNIKEIGLSNYYYLVSLGSDIKKINYNTSGPITNIRELGNVFPNVTGKNIYGLQIGSVNGGELIYGIGTINDGMISNFTRKGKLIIKANTYQNYYFDLPLLLEENECIYVQGNKILTALTNPNIQSFINGSYDNKIDKLNMLFSYCLIIDRCELDEGVGSSIDGVKYLTNLFDDYIPQIKYCAIGDSVTAGAYGEGWTQSNINGLSYANYLSEMIGAITFQKNAFSGYSIYNNFNDLINRINGSPNLITICLGLNDISLNLNQLIPIGDFVEIIKMNTVSDFTNVDAYGNTILGRYRWYLEKIKNLYPYCNIIAISMPHERLSSQSSIEAWNNILDGECAICNYLSIPYLNFINTSKIFIAYTDSSKPNWNDFLHDGCHPEKEGYRMMATAIYSLLKGLL